jgi:hypothetical protein
VPLKVDKQSRDICVRKAEPHLSALESALTPYSDADSHFEK